MAPFPPHRAGTPNSRREELGRGATVGRVDALLALASSVLWGTSDFLGGVLARKRPPLAIIGVGMSFGFVAMCAVATATGSWGAPLGYLPWAIAASVSGLVGLWAFYTALSIGTMGIVSPIAAAGIVVPLLGGLLFGDIPTALQAAGAVLAIAGLGFVVAPERGVMEAAPGAAATHKRSIMLAMLSALMFGISLASIAQGAQISTVMTMTSMRACSVTIMVVVALSLRSVGGMTRNDIGPAGLVGLLDVSANLTYGYSAAGGALVIAAVLGSLYPVVTVLLAWRVLHERLRKIQYAGITLALLGVVLMSLK